MAKITIGEQMVNAFVELGEDIDAIVDEIKHSLDAKLLPTKNSINEASKMHYSFGYSERRYHIFAGFIGKTR